MPYENTTDQDEVSILEVVGEMAKILLECKDYESLRKEVVNWLVE